MADLLDGHRGEALFVAGCRSNQDRFYPRFDHVVLFSAPLEVMLRRIAQRGNNPYRKTPEEQALIAERLVTVEPQLRRTATLEIDSSVALSLVVDRLERLVGHGRGSATA